MPHLTHFADGVLFTCIVCYFYTKKDLAWVFCGIIALLSMSYVIQTLKYDYFPDWSRPLFTFKKGTFHNITVVGECCNSFPSGHSAAAISMFTIFAYQWEKMKGYWGILAALFGILLAYTRIYIGVHFLGDVLVGGLIGLVLPLLSMTFAYPKLQSFFARKTEKTKKYYSLSLQFLAIVLGVFDIVRIAGIYGGWKMIVS